MLSQAIEFLNTVPFAGLMLVVAMGFLVGRLQLKGVALGPAPGTLAVALVLGYCGLRFDQLYVGAGPGISLGGFGFALFIYSVGFEAGPGLLSRRAGARTGRFMLVGSLVTVIALALTLTLAAALGLSSSAAAGVLAGTLTSAPTYAAALEVSADPTLLAVTFAVSYPFGLLGIVLLVQFLPFVMGDDLSDGVHEDAETEDEEAAGPELRRVFEVKNPEVIGKTFAELKLPEQTGCVVTRLHRGSSFTVPVADTRLEFDDHLMAKGRLESLATFGVLVGPEVYDHELRYRVPSPRAVHVHSPGVIGKSLRDLSLVQRFACVVTEIHRRGVVLEAGPDLVLERDDVVLVSGARTDVRRLAGVLGRFERSTHETDISVYAGGILFGLLLGEMSFNVAGVSLEVGSAVGLLVVGLLLGRFRRVGRLSAHVPVAARHLVRDLGILLFVGETGVAAGHGSWQALQPILWETLALAFVAAVLPAMITVLIARKILSMTPADSWGAVAGGMTSSAALVAVRNASDSNEPAASYAAAYAIASVLATLAGRIAILALG